MPDTAETVTVYGLLGFHVPPRGFEEDVTWLHDHADSAIYFLRPEWLPCGGWLANGYVFETAVELHVPVGSQEAITALNNSKAEGHITDG